MTRFSKIATRSPSKNSVPRSLSIRRWYFERNFRLAWRCSSSTNPRNARREFEAVKEANRRSSQRPRTTWVDSTSTTSTLPPPSRISAVPSPILRFPTPPYYLGFSYFKDGDLANAEKWLKEAHNCESSRFPHSVPAWFRISKTGPRRRGAESHGAVLRTSRLDDSEAQLRTSAERSWRGYARRSARRL